MTTTRKWSALGLVVILAVLAAGWFLLVAPRHSEAATLKGKTATQENANAVLRQRLAQLVAQEAELPRQRALLAEMTTKIPETPALPSLVRALTDAGKKAGVDLSSMSPAVPVAVAPGLVAAPAAGTVASPTGQSLYQVPLNLEVKGGYFELEQFFNHLEGLQRSLLVSGFTVAPGADAEGVSPGDLTVTIQGRVFVSQNAPTTTAAVVAPAATTTAQ